MGFGNVEQKQENAEQKKQIAVEEQKYSPEMKKNIDEIKKTLPQIDEKIVYGVLSQKENIKETLRLLESRTSTFSEFEEEK